MSESGYSSDEDCFFRDELFRLKKAYRVRGLVRKAAHGDIFLGNTRDGNRTEVILKVIKKRKTDICYLNGRRVPNEAKLHFLAYQADPTGTVAFLDCFERVSDFVIVMEKPENSIDLLEFVNEYGQLDFETTKKITAQLAQSSLLHREAGIAHCDLKDENLLFNPMTGCIKIIDFGNATRYEKVKADSFGTPAYYPPEVKEGSSFNTDSSTVYNIGCIAFTALTGSSPFDEKTFDFQRHVLFNGSLKRNERALLSNLLSNPVHRVQLEQLL